MTLDLVLRNAHRRPRGTGVRPQARPTQLHPAVADIAFSGPLALPFAATSGFMPPVQMCIVL